MVHLHNIRQIYFLSAQPNWQIITKKLVLASNNGRLGIFIYDIE
jgi:hypothetical protein